jgi:two-component system, cell cycle response regulator
VALPQAERTEIPGPAVRPRVLVVEDDPDLRGLLVQVLTGRGYEVAAHADGAAAWAAVAGADADYPLVILDRRLPGLDGLELCRRLRSRPGGDSAVIVVATGSVGTEELAAILDAGANDYLAKPFSLKLLQIRLAIAERLVAELRRRKELEERLRQMALHDVLTGLPNRTLFFDRLKDALARSTRTGRHVAVLYLDLDHFKAVNDGYGHDVGDLLLIETGRRLAGRLRDQDTVARFGGDEFVALLGDLEAPEIAAAVAQRLFDAVEPPFELGGQTVRITISLGVAVASSAQADPTELVARADAALYRAKQAGRARIAHASPES